MNCADARHLIHLDVGDDLRTDEEQQLAGHMECCTECRAYHAGTASAISVLLSLRNTSSTDLHSETTGHSVWPAVSREIVRRRTSPAADRKFNLQVAALSVCSLSLAVVTIVQSLSVMRASAGRGVAAQPASFFAGETDRQFPKVRQFPGVRPLPGDDDRSVLVPYFPSMLPESGPQAF